PVARTRNGVRAPLLAHGRRLVPTPRQAWSFCSAACAAFLATSTLPDFPCFTACRRFLMAASSLGLRCSFSAASACVNASCACWTTRSFCPELPASIAAWVSLTAPVTCPPCIAWAELTALVKTTKPAAPRRRSSTSHRRARLRQRRSGGRAGLGGQAPRSPAARPVARVHAPPLGAAAPRRLAVRQGQRRVDPRQVQELWIGRADRDV